MNEQQGQSAAASGSPGQWEREAISRLATAALAEQRRSRRWGILFKSLALFYVFLFLFVVVNVDPLFGSREQAPGPHVGLIDMEGMIVRGGDVDADRVATGLRRAFEHEETEAVILRINSPGGSPVQSDQIYNEIMRLREEHEDIPVYAVGGDIMASGAYYIASAADEIYVNPASIVGSIGVIFGGFGFDEAIERIGVERRVYASGDDKALLDPFQPEDEGQIAHMRGLIDEIHQQFIGAVEAGRGDRLNGDPDELFSGLVWTGNGAIERGLADGIGSTGQVARDVIENDNLRDFTRRPPLLERLTQRMGAGVASGLRGYIEPGFR